MPTLAFGLTRTAPGVDVLVQHENAAVAAAARYLIDTGSERLAFISNATQHTRAGAREAAFVHAAAARGLTGDVMLRVRPTRDGLSPDMWVAQRAVELFRLPKAQRPDTVMCGSDRGAINVMWAAIQEGLRIPEDVRVVGAGNIDECMQVSPHLTTVGCVDVDYRPAVEHLVERISSGPQKPVRTSVPWQLIVRGTT